MFHAGEVAPSCDFLLQLLTGPGEVAPLVGLFVGLHLPELGSPVLDGSAGLAAPYAEEALLVTERPRSRAVGVEGPVFWGLTAPDRPPIACGKLLGLTLCAARLNAPRHWRT